MDDKQTWRLEQLKGPWCSAAFLQELHGLDLLRDDALMGRFRAWASRFWKGNLVERQSGTDRLFDRHALETFLQQSGLL